MIGETEGRSPRPFFPSPAFEVLSMLCRRYHHALLALAAALLVLPGCSGRAAVQGSVTLNGAPVDGGVIVFAPAKGGSSQPTVSADIVGGKYSLPAGKGPTPGSYRVSISWKKKTGKKVDTPGDSGNQMDEAVEVIPASYNSQSTQTAEVKSGENTFNFDVK